jgi:hypothetical protein
MKRLLPILILLGSLALSVQARADTVNWGSSFFGTHIQSDGSPITATFNFEIGTFGSSFIPDETNVGLWEANWQVLDAAPYFEFFSFFTGSFDLQDHPTNPGQVVSTSPDADPVDFFVGEQVYIWVYNTATPGPGAEWVLITDNDGLNGDDWVLPDPDDQTVDPLQWRVSTATDAIFGGLNDVSGPGERTGGPPVFDLQTHTFVPEPSSALLLITGAGLLLLRRKNFEVRNHRKP